MDNSIKRLVLSIFITICLVIVSIPLWGFTSGKNGTVIASAYNDMEIDVYISDIPRLAIYSDDLGLTKAKATKLSLRNQNRFEKNTTLTFYLDKNSTVDYKYLRVSLNDNIYDLSKIEPVEKEDGYYFVLLNTDIKEYTTIEYDLRIWINNKVTNLSEKSFITSNFYTR